MDNVTLIRIETGEAVQSVNDLRENIKTLKDRLGDLQIGSEEYQDTLQSLKQNQSALKDAMYATTASMEDVTAAAKGINVVFDEQNKLVEDGNVSYNALVHKMADLKAEWRATGDEARRAELGEQINQINDKLKSFDASVGTFGRNVGNYEGALKNFHNIVKDLPKPLSAVKDKLDVVDKSMNIMSVNPVFGIVALLSPVLKEIVGLLKDNETAVAGVQKAMVALEPVMDFMKGVIQKVAEYFSKAVDYVLELASNSTTSFADIISGAVGVGNSILQFLLTPIRTVISAVKGLGETFKNVFSGDFEAAAQSAKDALLGIGDAFKKGFDFKASFDAGKQAGAEFASGLGSSKPDMDAAAGDMATSAAEEFVLKFKEIAEPSLHDIYNAAERYVKEQMWNPWADLDKMIEDELESVNAEVSAYIDEEIAMQAAALAEQEKNEKARKKLLQDRVKATIESAKAIGSILGTIATMYEQDSKNSEKNAKKIKGLRIAEATISTITGAIGAFMQASASIAPPFGQIIGAVQAAAVTATGIAQIAKIKSTDVSGNSSASPSAISVAAPSVSADIPETRIMTSATDEVKLNQMASDQRVYIVASDIAESQDHIRTQVQESSF